MTKDEHLAILRTMGDVTTIDSGDAHIVLLNPVGSRWNGVKGIGDTPEQAALSAYRLLRSMVWEETR